MDTDVLIIGAGPAGLQAAIHAARKKAGVIIMGKSAKSSLMSAMVENYCCMESAADGREMLKQGIKQAAKFGASFMEQDVLKIDIATKGFNIETENGEHIAAKALIFCMGISRNKLGVPGEKEYHGKGVSYCIECDANFFKGKKVTVVGNGSAAAAGAVLLAFYASEVTLVSMSLAVSEKLHGQIKASGVIYRPGTWVGEITGNGKKVTGFKDTAGVLTETDGVFIELGAKGAMELAAGIGVALEGEKLDYIQVDKKQSTSVAGVFAAGDICGPPFQLAKAVGEGCVAGTNAADYAKNPG
jgi:thioredoxin reductase (NADPH)